MFNPTAAIGSSWSVRRLALGVSRGLAALAVALALGACGGQMALSEGGGASKGRATVTILWPARSRLVPLATESIRVRVRATSGVTLAESIANRPPVGTSSTIAFDDLPVGELLAMATAFPQTDARGTPLASGVAQLAVRPYNVAQASLTMDTTIEYLAFTPSTLHMTVGDALDLAVAAYDAGGSVVLMTPASGTWTVSDLTVLSKSPNGFLCRLGAVGSGPVRVTYADSESGKSVQLETVVAALPITVSLSPLLASVEARGTRQFTATVGGSADQRVLWTIDEPAGGSVSSTGLFEAPASAGGPYHVRATSVADPSKSAVAAVTVTAEVNTGNGEVEIR